MPAITIRNVPQATRDELAARAASSGRSLQEYLRAHLIDVADKPDRAKWLASVREIKRNSASTVTVEQILDDLDADRR